MPSTGASCVDSLNPCENCINKTLRCKVHAQWARQSFHILENNPNFIETVRNDQHKFYSRSTGDFVVDPMAEYDNEVHRRSLDIIPRLCSPRNSFGSAEGPFTLRGCSGTCSFDTPFAPKLTSRGPNPLGPPAESTLCVSSESQSKLIKVPDRTRQRVPSPLGVESTADTMPADLAAEILYCIRTYEPAAFIGVELTLGHVAEARYVLSLQNGPASQRKKCLEELRPNESTTELTRIPAPTLAPLTDSRMAGPSRCRTWPKELVRHCRAVGPRMKSFSHSCYMMLTRSKPEVDGPYYDGRGPEERRSTRPANPRHQI